MSRQLIESICDEYRRYKALGEGAFAQLRDADLSKDIGEDANAVAVIVWHLGGNLKSRFTDFRTADGEKPWRNRDEEFTPREVSRHELLAKWEDGWSALFSALGELSDGDLSATVVIRGQTLTVAQALFRSLAHTAYHVGQIVYIAKVLAGSEWRSLSIPRGASTDYNQNPTSETAKGHAAALKSGS